MLEWVYVAAVLGTAIRAAWIHARETRGLRERRAWRLALFALLLAGAVVFRRDLGMQKMASALVLPSSLLWLGLGGLTLRLAAGGHRALAAWSGALFAIYTLLGNIWIAALLLGRLERDVPKVDVAALPELDAVLVLGGGASFHADGNAQLTDYGDRVMLAARIQHAGKARVLVTSGSSIPRLHRPHDLSAATHRIWSEIGVPEAAIIRLPEPRNTSQEITAFAELVRARGFQKLGLVSSAWHLPRALLRCREAGLEVLPLAADRRAGEPVFHPAHLIPSPGGFRVAQLALWEMGGAMLGR